ncbi:MAG: CBS domain-containing protein [bacterium]
MLRSVELKDHMLTTPAKVLTTDSIFVAMDKIIEQRISGVCVVDDNDNLLGVLSETDCLRAILSATYNESGIGSVAEFMTAEVVTANITDDIIDVASDMLRAKHRRRPVVEDGKLVGQITCRRLLMAVRNFSGNK